MKKSEILKNYSNKTGISYKHQDLFVGDVYEGELGVRGIVISKILEDGSTKYYFKKTNNCEHALPECRAGMNNGTFIANVVQDEELMKTFIDAGIIIDDDNETENKETETMVKKETKAAEQPKEVPTPPVAPAKEEKPKKTTKKAETKSEVKEEPKTAETKPKNILEKISAVRAAWTKEDIDKQGKGRAGGGAKYDYYKPQQIIDFCLKHELENRLYSRFTVMEDRCYYEVINMDNIQETEIVSCPFDVPRKMAASEAQQVGAAMTYYNRRLAMMMYKIEDNSRESVEVMEDADYTNTAPAIPAPPTIPVPPTPSVETQLPPTPPTNIQAEVNSEPVSEPKVQDDKTVPPASENAKSDIVAGEIEQKGDVMPPPPPVIEQPKTASVPPTPPTATPPVQPTPPVAEQPKAEVKKGSIQDLY